MAGWALVYCVQRSPNTLADATAISFLNPIVTMALAIPLLVELVGLVRRMAVRISLIGAVILIRPVTDAFQPAALLALGVFPTATAS